MKQSAINSPRLTALRRKRKKAFRIKLLAFFFVIALLVTGFAFASRIKKFNLDTVVVEGNKVVESAEIETETKNILAGKYFWIFPKTNLLIYPKHAIENSLMSKFKRIKNVSFNIDNFKTLHLKVSEYDGKYLWCGESVPDLGNTNILANSQCYFLDSNGYLFDTAPYFSGNVYFKFYGPLVRERENIIGSSFSPNNFTQIISLKENMSKMNLKPTSFFKLAGEEHEGEGFIALGGEPMASPHLTFKINSDYEKLAENLQAAISTDPLKTELKDKFDSLLYIDLRFGNKVYYRFH